MFIYYRCRNYISITENIKSNNCNFNDFSYVFSFQLEIGISTISLVYYQNKVSKNIDSIHRLHIHTYTHRKVDQLQKARHNKGNFINELIIN